MKREPLNFLELVRPDINGKGPNFLYKLGGNEESSISRRICVQSHHPCPINDIIIVENNKVSNYPSFVDVPLENNKTLLFTTQSRFLPIVEFKLTEGAPGIDATEYDFSDNRRIYKLIDRSTYKGGITYLDDDLLFDERYRLVATEDEHSLYKDNKVLEVLK